MEVTLLSSTNEISTVLAVHICMNDEVREKAGSRDAQHLKLVLISFWHELNSSEQPFLER